MEKEKTATGSISISLMVDCPYCDEFIWDKYDCQDQFEQAQEETDVFHACGDFTCPKCKKDFYVESFEY